MGIFAEIASRDRAYLTDIHRDGTHIQVGDNGRKMITIDADMRLGVLVEDHTTGPHNAGETIVTTIVNGVADSTSSHVPRGGRWRLGRVTVSRP